MVYIPPFPPWIKHPDKPPLKEDGEAVRVAPEKLEPGDVVLSYTDFTAGNWVRQIEKGGYSHAALFDGEQVIEAASPGKDIRRIPMAEHLSKVEYVDVYRYGRTAADDLIEEERAAVAAAARSYIERRYGTVDAALVGILAVTRRFDLPGGGEDSLRAVLDQAARWLQDQFDSAGDWLTCSELVYRAYLEAEPPGTHPLEIAPLYPDTPDRIRQVLARSRAAVGTGAAVAVEAVEAVEASRERFAELYIGQWPRGVGTLGEASAAVGGDDAPVADYVTPRDLENSPSLRRIGRAFKDDYPAP